MPEIITAEDARYAYELVKTICTEVGPGLPGSSQVRMFGEGHSGWGMFPATEVLGLVVGSIVLKPAVVEWRIEPREILHLTVVFEHDVIDGAPAARFTRRLVELIESEYGLGEDRTITAIDIEPAEIRTDQVFA